MIAQIFPCGRNGEGDGDANPGQDVLGLRGDHRPVVDGQLRGLAGDAAIRVGDHAAEQSLVEALRSPEGKNRRIRTGGGAVDPGFAAVCRILPLIAQIIAHSRDREGDADAFLRCDVLGLRGDQRAIVDGQLRGLTGDAAVRIGHHAAEASAVEALGCAEGEDGGVVPGGAAVDPGGAFVCRVLPFVAQTVARSRDGEGDRRAFLGGHIPGLRGDPKGPARSVCRNGSRGQKRCRQRENEEKGQQTFSHSRHILSETARAPACPES